MSRLDAFARGFSTNLALIGGLMLIASAVYVSAEVLGRRFFGFSLGGANEMSSYALAISSAWAFSYAVYERAHIRIDAAYQLGSPAVRAFIDVISMAALAATGALLLWFSFRLVAFAWANEQRANTPLQTPMWIPLALWYSGLVLFFLISLLVTVRAALAWARGDYALVTRIAGMASSEAELEAPELVAAAERSTAKKPS
jgi:TRAP-type C4-dicarboxylate transport system permease small subunit